MSSERIFNVRPDSKIGALFASAPSSRFFLSTARVPMAPSLTVGMKASAKTNRLSYSPSSVTWMYCLAAYNFWSVKSKWVNTKTRISLVPRRTTFASTSTKTTPWSLWFFGRLGYLLWIDLLGWTNFDITDATAPTPARSFGDLDDILSKSVKERMGRW